MRKIKLLLSGLLAVVLLHAQETFPVNGVADKRTGSYAFINATIVKDAQTTLQNATLIIKEGKIVAVGVGLTAPKDAVVIDCKDKYIYPSFIDIYSDYGITAPQRQQGGGFNFNQPSQITSNTKGAYNWNQAIKPETDAYKQFNVDDAKAKPLRDAGFGTVLTHVKDGIARGTGTVVTLANTKDNFVIVKEKASAHYSLSKGTSTQSYPSSVMGSIALLRQTYLDAQWYKNKPATEGTNISLEAFNETQSLPQIFEGNDKWTDLRGYRIGKEFGVQYVIKAGGNEYQRINELAATKATFILSLNYPQAMDVEDPNDARAVSLADMKNWELAPTNAAAFEKANIPFCLTTADLRDTKTFMTNLRKAMDMGLSETKAFEALTKTPATLLNVYDKVGSLEAGKLANFVITSAPIFKEGTTIYSNWVQGEKYAVNESAWNDIKGIYNLIITTSTGTNNYTVDVKSSSSASVIAKDTLNTRISFDGKVVKLNFNNTATQRNSGFGGGFGGRGGAGNAGALNGKQFRLTGFVSGDSWNGYGEDTAGNKITWSASFVKPIATTETANRRTTPTAKPLGKVTYPFDGYGNEELPKQEDILIKNATVWTNEKEGILHNTDVLVKNGKIAKVGKNLSAAGAKEIDGTGKHLTPGIIDEHSHIAVSSINEGGQSVTSEVRIADNLNPEDINIYRQLSGGVTSSHILHGSANTIGGQTQLIKLRWGADDEGLKFKNWDPFIKFALGENVKRTTSQNNNRFPDTRMGVEEVLNDAFARARDYENAMKLDPTHTRRDLELDALVEILNKKRFITCHSYVQSEITAAMRVAEKYGFRFNTFTHILEGYKVADKLKAHGANASTFSDWWYYKVEVTDAIAYNAAIMHKAGLNVCINSDDAEMARRLNQEAAKTIKYGGVTEEDALKMVTLNPAKALHVADRVGSIKEGKDADLVLWSNNPLSIYAMSLYTIVDGTIYFSRDKDLEQRKKIAAEKERLIQKLIAEKRVVGPGGVRPAEPSWQIILSCGDHAEHNGLFTVDIQEGEETTSGNK
ncbi:MAG: amidohydrolase family protein [Bacteroidetes bacterium]|nr:amidohydrolase family protein [Bacteroidota bacterium]